MSASIIINDDKKIKCWAPESFMDEIEIKLGKNIRFGESFDMEDIEILKASAQAEVS